MYMCEISTYRKELKSHCIRFTENKSRHYGLYYEHLVIVRKVSVIGVAGV